MTGLSPRPCCTKSEGSFGILHNVDCPAYCAAHDSFACLIPHEADMYGQLVPGPPTRILAFTGTVVAFFDYLRTFLGDPAVNGCEDSQDEIYEWELTASIARHPAGKGLTQRPTLNGTRG